MAPKFLEWLNPSQDLDWIDIGCGTGALSESISKNHYPTSISCVDPSESFLEKTKDRIGNSCITIKSKADEIPLDNQCSDIVVSGLALNFFPEPDKAINEMKRVLRNKGVIAAYVWDYSGRMDMLRYFWDNARKIDSSAATLDEGARFPICSEENLNILFNDSGLKSVITTSIDIDTRFDSFDDFWKPFLGKQGPAPSFYSNLEDAKQKKVVELIREALPINSDGTVNLIARAFAVRGIK